MCNCGEDIFFNLNVCKQREREREWEKSAEIQLLIISHLTVQISSILIIVWACEPEIPIYTSVRIRQILLHNLSLSVSLSMHFMGLSKKKAFTANKFTAEHIFVLWFEKTGSLWDKLTRVFGVHAHVICVKYKFDKVKIMMNLHKFLKFEKTFCYWPVIFSLLLSIGCLSLRQTCRIFLLLLFQSHFYLVLSAKILFSRYFLLESDLIVVVIVTVVLDVFYNQSCHLLMLTNRICVNTCQQSNILIFRLLSVDILLLLWFFISRQKGGKTHCVHENRRVCIRNVCLCLCVCVW